MSSAEKLLFALNQRGLCTFAPPEPLPCLPSLDCSSTPLISGRQAQELSLEQAQVLLKQSLSSELDALLGGYFLAHWIVVGIQSIRALPNSRPQHLHRDHKLGPQACMVWAMSLDPEIVLDTLFCPGSHKQHNRSITRSLTRQYPPISLDASGILYDSAIVHAGQSSEMACSPARIFISFASEYLSDSELAELAAFNGIQQPLMLSRQEVLRL